MPRQRGGRSGLEFEFQRRTDDVDVSGLAASIVLSHVIKLAGDMLVEGVARADGGPVAHPIAQSPVIKDLVRNEPHKILFLDFEWMLQAPAIAIAPRIDQIGRASWRERV